MGLLDWLKKREREIVPSEIGKPSRTHSVFGDYPDRVLKTEADVKKDDALLEMSLVVNEITKDPDSNWRKHKADFEKAVHGMRDAFEPDKTLKRDEHTVVATARDDAETQQDRASRQQPGRGRSMER